MYSDGYKEGWRREMGAIGTRGDVEDTGAGTAAVVEPPAAGAVGPCTASAVPWEHG